MHTKQTNNDASNVIEYLSIRENNPEELLDGDLLQLFALYGEDWDELLDGGIIIP